MNRNERMVPVSSLKLHPRADLVPDMRESEWSEFYTDIAFKGITTPLEMLADGTILDGRHRFKAAQELGLESVAVVDAPLMGDDPEMYMLKTAVLRRHLTDDQRAVMAARWVQENKVQGQRTSEPRRSEVSTHPTRDEAIGLFNVPQRRVSEATTLMNRQPELAEQVRQGAVSMRDARQETNRERRQEKRERITESLSTPVALNEKYAVIYADPPWEYDWNKSESRDLDNQYPQMSLEDIKALDVPSGDDAVLFLWATSPKLEEALQVMNAWGFEYRTNMVWVKDRVGMGYYARQQHELLLIGKRGELPVPEPEVRPPSVFTHPRLQHSEKPEPFYSLLESMYPDLPKIELFARNKRDGWDRWGNQA